MNNRFGLYGKSFLLIVETLKCFKAVEKAWIFGSRATGNYQQGSDVDLAISGDQVDLTVVANLYGVLNEEVSIPYFVDVVDINAVESRALRKQIADNGVLFYQKDALLTQ